MNHDVVADDDDWLAGLLGTFSAFGVGAVHISKKMMLSLGRRGIPCHHSHTICSRFLTMCNPPTRNVYFQGPGPGWLAAWLAWLGGRPPRNPVMLDNGVGQLVY